MPNFEFVPVHSLRRSKKHKYSKVTYTWHIQLARKIRGEKDWDKGTTDWEKVKPGYSEWLKWTVLYDQCLWFHGRANQSGVGDTQGEHWTVGVYCVCDLMGGRTNQGWETHRVNVEQWGFIVSVISWEGVTNQGWETHGWIIVVNKINWNWIYFVSENLFKIHKDVVDSVLSLLKKIHIDVSKHCR